MKSRRTSASLVALVVVCSAVLAYAADRVRSGQWETTVNVMGRAMTSSACISESDATAMNGDVASIRALHEKRDVTHACAVTTVVITGDQVVVTSVCSGKENVGTTTYHGDTFESVNTNGVKSQAKRVGACK